MMLRQPQHFHTQLIAENAFGEGFVNDALVVFRCVGLREEKIAELQKKKRDLADAILDGGDQKSILKDLSVEDLELLLT